MQKATGGELAGQGNAAAAKDFNRLIAYLENPAPEVRAEAIRAIGGFGQKAELPLMKALDDEDLQVRRSAIRGLALTADRSGKCKQRLVDLLVKEDLAEEARKALDRQGFSCLRELIAALDRPKIGSAARELLQALFGQAPRNAWSLGQHHDLLAALPGLSTVAQGLCSLALVLLACDEDLAMACPQLTPYLTEALRSEQAPERKQAALSLARIAALAEDPDECPLDQRTIESLTAVLSDVEPGPRYAAAWALEMCGQAAVSATLQLQARLGDPDPLVQQSAAWALERIQNPIRDEKDSNWPETSSGA